jgi:hypothetical protein
MDKSTSKIKKELLFLQRVDMASRKTGRTTAIINAAKSFGENAVVIVHSEAFARKLRQQHPDVTIVAREGAEQIHWGHDAVFLDHHLSDIALSRAVGEIERLESELEKFKKKDKQ